jgi:hypothetical protein
MASFAKYTRTTDQTGVVANTAVICNVLESALGSDIAVNTVNGSITLEASKTYRLRGTVGYCNTTSTGAGMSYQWFNVTGNAWVGQGGGIVSPSSSATDAWQSGTAEYVFTPGVNTTVQLRVVGAITSNAITPNNGNSYDTIWRIGAPFIDIEVIGQPVPTSGEPTWTTAGTLQAVGISATTTAPQFWTTGTVTRNAVRYKQIGAKTYEVQVAFNGTGLGGGTTGSGDYLFSLPAGLQFDSGQQPFYTGAVITSSFEPMSWQIPGNQVFMNRNGDTVTYNIGSIVPWDATRYRVCLPIIGTGVYCWSSVWYQPPSGTIFGFNWAFTVQTP